MARNNYSIIHALKKTTLANSFDRCKVKKCSSDVSSIILLTSSGIKRTEKGECKRNIWQHSKAK